MFLQRGPVTLGVGTSRDHHFVGTDRAVGGFNSPAVAFARQTFDSRLLKNLSTQAGDRSGQALGVTHGVDGACTAIKQRSGNLVGTAVFLTARTGEQLDIGTATGPLLVAGFKVSNTTGVVSHVQGASVVCLAVNTQAFDGGENFSWRFAEHLVQATALQLAKGGFNVIGTNPGTGVDQADVAPGTAVTDFPGLQHNHRLALFEQVQRSAQTGNAAADDADVGLEFGGQFIDRRSELGDMFPQTLLTQLWHGRLPHYSCSVVRLSPARSAPTGSWHCRRLRQRGDQSNTIPCASGSSRE
ncbi:hypothetical protein D3C79_458410 [compost metagenome]